MNNYLLGAITGDCCGAYYEFGKERTKNYNDVVLVKRQNRFTDDTVCTIGVADAIIKYGNPTVEEFRDSIQEWCKKYPNRGYGGKFRDWINNPVPYGSWGNGSAMRVSACGLAAKSEEEAYEMAVNSAECSHNTPEARLGAAVIAKSIYYAKAYEQEVAYEKITELFESAYPEYVDKNLYDIRPKYHFDSSCVGTVPIALLAFLESEDYEDCLKLAISMGGDADTLAAIAGSIAYVYYREMQKDLFDNITKLLPYDMKQVIKEFDKCVNITIPYQI